MIPVTRQPFAFTASVVALCLASASALAGAPIEEPAAALPSDTSASVEEPPSPADLTKAGLAGALVGAGAGFAAASVATGAAWGLWLLQNSLVPGPSSEVRNAVSVVALATPGLLVVLPALGAGLSARSAVGASTDEEGADTVGVAVGLGSAGLAAVGGLTGVAVGGALGLAQAGGGFGSSAQLAAMTFAGPMALVGAGAGAAFGAALGAVSSSSDLAAAAE